MSEPSWTVPNREEKRGYQRKRKRLTITFEGHETLEGLEIVCRSVSFGKALELAAYADEFETSARGSDTERAAAHRMMAELVDVCDEWNYRDDDGRPVEMTVDFLMQEFDFPEAMLILRGWQQSMQGVSAPLPQSSADGQQSVEAQIPMDIPSESRAS